MGRSGPGCNSVRSPRCNRRQPHRSGSFEGSARRSRGARSRSYQAEPVHKAPCHLTAEQGLRPAWLVASARASGPPAQPFCPLGRTTPAARFSPISPDVPVRNRAVRGAIRPNRRRPRRQLSRVPSPAVETTCPAGESADCGGSLERCPFWRGHPRNRRKPSRPADALASLGH